MSNITSHLTMCCLEFCRWTAFEHISSTGRGISAPKHEGRAPFQQFLERNGMQYLVVGALADGHALGRGPLHLFGLSCTALSRDMRVSAGARQYIGYGAVQRSFMNHWRVEN